MKARPEHSEAAHKRQCDIVTLQFHTAERQWGRGQGQGVVLGNLNLTAKVNSTDSILQNYHEALQAQSVYMMIIFS